MSCCWFCYGFLRFPIAFCCVKARFRNRRLRKLTEGRSVNLRIVAVFSWFCYVVRWFCFGFPRFPITLCCVLVGSGCRVCCLFCFGFLGFSIACCCVLVGWVCRVFVGFALVFIVFHNVLLRFGWLVLLCFCLFCYGFL